MNNTELKKRLLELKQKEKSFDKLLNDFNFKTENEALTYIKENESKFEELKKIKEEIRKIKWGLLSDEEKKRTIEKENLLAEKYKKK
ncbi:hypothetical protein [Epilithonimonas sp.]|uniref:hypothetical protein n=1 Tax=Epilithonimonas sp. TaxID=2894511 RepID=UPI0035B3B98C